MAAKIAPTNAVTAGPILSYNKPIGKAQMLPIDHAMTWTLPISGDV